MPAASYVKTSFLGGIWSKAMQGRTDRPDYSTAMNECLNSLPLEQGAWTRRSGTRFASWTRFALPGRVLPFDFRAASPYTMEFTNSKLRFRSGTNLVETNDAKIVFSISSGNPAEVTTSTNHGWSTFDQVIFPFSSASSSAALVNRPFIIAVTAP